MRCYFPVIRLVNFVLVAPITVVALQSVHVFRTYVIIEGTLVSSPSGDRIAAGGRTLDLSLCRPVFGRFRTYLKDCFRLAGKTIGIVT